MAEIPADSEWNENQRIGWQLGSETDDFVSWVHSLERIGRGPGVPGFDESIRYAMLASDTWVEALKGKHKRPRR